MIVFFAILVLLFGFVVFRGAPYLPTRKKQINQALDLLNLKPEQSLIELGSGDGSVLIAAAKRNIYATGYELNPILVIISRVRCWRYRKYAKVLWGDFWLKSWPKADGIYVFLLDKYMKKLDKKVIQYAEKNPCKLVSYTFKIPHRKATKSVDGLHLYIYK